MRQLKVQKAKDITSIVTLLGQVSQINLKGALKRCRLDPSIIAKTPTIIFSTIRSSLQEAFCKKGVLRNFAKFTGKHLCQSLIFKKVADLKPAILLKKSLQQRYFPVNVEKFLRTPFLSKHLQWLPLNNPIIYFFRNVLAHFQAVCSPNKTHNTMILQMKYEKSHAE